MTGVSIKYNDVDWIEVFNDLDGQAVVTDVNRNIASNFNNTYQDQGNHRYGQQFLYNTLSVKQISISLKLTGSNAYFNEVVNKIGGFLNMFEPKRLIFGDEPDKIWEAIPSGQPTLTTDNSTSPPTATITITFDVPKSYAESQTQCLVDNLNNSRYGSITKVSNDHYKIKLNNFGSATAYPKIKIKHNSENGWIGIVKSATEAYEIGNPEETDAEVVKQSELLFDYRDGNITNGLSAAQKNVAILNDTSQNLVGTVASVDWAGRKHLFLQSAGGTTGNNAGSLTWDIPTDSAGGVGSINDYIWWRQVFWLGATNQYGFIKLTVSDDQGKFLYGVETYKRAQGLGCEYNFMASDGAGGFKMIKRWMFNGTHEDSQNPFNEPRGWSDLKRNDDRVTVHWWGSYNTYVIPEIKGKKSAKIHVAFGAIGNKPLVARMYLDGIYYRKDFVPVTKDIPNAFSIGSVLEVDMAKGKTYLNNLPTMDGLAYLAEPFGLDPGENEIDIYFSSWITKEPEIEVTWYERSV